MMSTNQPCRCCDDPAPCDDAMPATVPLPVFNPPRRDTISLRIGEHRDFFRSLLRRVATSRPGNLGRMLSRDFADPSIALFDSWSVICDVLTFYNEQYFQEAYLRTAKESRSLQELSKLIGYKPGPGVASSTFVAFTLEGMPGQGSLETIIPKGTPLESVPGSNETSQRFETMHDLIARPEWNAILPRQTRPQHITPENVEQIESIAIQGTTPRLVANDLLLFDFGPGKRKHLRYVKRSEPNEDFASTTVHLVQTKYSAQKYIDEVYVAFNTLKERLETLDVEKELKDIFINDIAAQLNALRPQDGLVTIDNQIREIVRSWEDLYDLTGGQLSNKLSDVDLEVTTIKNTLGKLLNIFSEAKLDVKQISDVLESDFNKSSGFAKEPGEQTRNGLILSLNKINPTSETVRNQKEELISDIRSINFNDANSFLSSYLQKWVLFSDLATSVFKTKKVTQDAFNGRSLDEQLGEKIEQLKVELNANTQKMEWIKTLQKYSSDDGLKEFGGDQPIDINAQLISNAAVLIKTEAKGLNGRLKSITQSLSGWSTSYDQVHKELRSINEPIIYPYTTRLELSGVYKFLSDIKTLFDAANLPLFYTAIRQFAKIHLEQFKLDANKAILSFFAAPPGSDPSNGLVKRLKECVEAGLSIGAIITDSNAGISKTIAELNRLGKLSEGDILPPLRVLIIELEYLQRSTAEFTLDTGKPVNNDEVIQNAGLADALKQLRDTNDPSVADAGRRLEDILKGGGDGVPDLLRQLATSRSPQLRDQLIALWREIRSKTQNPKVFAHKTIIPLFGFNAPKMNKLSESLVTSEERKWSEVNNTAWMNGEAVYLSQPVEGVTAGSSVVFRCTPNEDLVCTVASATSPVQPGVLDIPAAGSLLRLMDGKWHKSVNVNGDSPITLLRQTSALLPSHELVLAEVPIPDPVGGDRNAAASSDEIELDGLYPELDAGRSVVLSGERYYPSGVRGQEFARVRYVSHRLSERPNDSVHTFVRLERPIRQSYRRSKLQILANVVAATHGKSVTSIIGHGDATQRFQSMPLDQGPLTYLPAANETGVNSTLEVRVNELRWHETDSLLVSKAAARDYVILQFGDGKQAVQFGDGKTGARLPTGNSNVVANYRIGLGSSGNVKPNSITQLISRPLGIKEVTNPLPATGGADPEGIDQIRANAPIAVMALDRLVSVRDYADFARNYAGIDKAIAATIQISGQSYVGVTVAGAADIPIEGSDLMMNLGQAYRHLGDPLQPVIVKERDLLRLFIAANVKLKPDYDWAFVHPKLRQKLFDSFAFARRELGQDLYLSEVYSAIHSVEGVALATIELFATTSQNDLEQDLTKQDGSDGFFNYLSDARTKHPTRLPAHTGKVIGDQFKPAQLIYLSRDVPDSLLLTEIKS